MMSWVSTVETNLAQFLPTVGQIRRMFNAQPRALFEQGVMLTNGRARLDRSICRLKFWSASFLWARLTSMDLFLIIKPMGLHKYWNSSLDWPLSINQACILYPMKGDQVPQQPQGTGGSYSQNSAPVKNVSSWNGQEWILIWVDWDRLKLDGLNNLHSLSLMVYLDWTIMTVEFLLCMSTSTNLVVTYLLIFTFSVFVLSYLSLLMRTFYFSLLMHAFVRVTA